MLVNIALLMEKLESMSILPRQLEMVEVSQTTFKIDFYFSQLY